MPSRITAKPDRNGTLAAVPGYNLWMTKAAAAMGVVQIRRLDAMNARRRAVAARLAAGLRGLPLDLPVERPGRRHVFQMYSPTLHAGVDRGAVLAGLQQRGVGVSVHWEPASHELPAYRYLGFPVADLPVTARLVDRVLSVPMHSCIEDAHADAVVSALHEVLR